MRLGRTAWLILGVGAFVIILATLLVVYVGKSGEEKQKTTDLTTAETQLTTFISQRETAESQLAEKQSALADALSLLNRTRVIYPELTENIEYDEVLAELAQDCNLELISMGGEEPGKLEVEDVTFMVIAFEVQVRGTVSNMLNMVHAIAVDERLPTAGVGLVDIKTRIKEGLEPLGTIKFVGYSYSRE